MGILLVICICIRARVIVMRSKCCGVDYLIKILKWNKILPKEIILLKPIFCAD